VDLRRPVIAVVAWPTDRVAELKMFLPDCHGKLVFVASLCSWLRSVLGFIVPSPLLGLFSCLSHAFRMPFSCLSHDPSPAASPFLLRLIAVAFHFGQHASFFCLRHAGAAAGWNHHMRTGTHNHPRAGKKPREHAHEFTQPPRVCP
jgi:hypothetical protein